MRPAIHVILISIAATLCSADEASPTAPLKSEIPPVFTANTESFDFVRRTEMIPMRDGVKLYTVMTEPLKISGSPIVNLIAAMTGTDGDFVVKLIDVYPDEVGREPKMGGYQLMISADIFRGRYLDGFDQPRPIRANEKERYRFSLPDANHVFLPGHRLMIQVQSSWFPLYDRNPQTYVSNILQAKPSDYRKSSIKVFDAGDNASFVELPVVKSR